MAQDKFLIAPIKHGLVNDVASWLTPEDAFERLDNAYVHHGKIIKRFGGRYTGTGASQTLRILNSKLRIPLLGGAGVGTTDPATGNATGTVPGGGYGRAGQMFSIGTEVFTVQTTGTPIAMLESNGVATTHTFDTTSGVYNFVAATVNTQIYFYPGEPVMGLFNYEEGDIHNRPAIACDTRLIYKFNGVSWNAIGPIAGGVHVPFQGDNAQFFNATNWTGTQLYDTFMFFTNFNATVTAPAGTDDDMWYWDGATWTLFQPKFLVAGTGVQNIVVTARLIVPFKDRLVLLSTIENDAAGNNRAYPYRCRYSHNGSSVAASAWYEKDEVGYTGGGWIEAPTKEEIISAEFIKDRLIVYFERSTWELAYTGNQTLPFTWQKINTELGSESPRSSVPFDKAILTIGTTGVHACTGANVQRIDEPIPEEIFNVRNENSGAFRVAGIRDYQKELVYWTIPYINDGAYADVFPNKVLCYNYDENIWSFNDDSITAFGFFEQLTGGDTWEFDFETWAEDTSDWIAGVINPQPVQIIAGNQHGFVFMVDTDRARNESVLQIVNIAYVAPTVTLTIINHNLKNDDFIKIENCEGSVELNDIHFVVTVVNANTVTVFTPGAVTAYEGLGVAALVSRIDILTKRFNPYIKTGDRVSVEKIDFAVGKTELGQLDVEYYASSSDFDLGQEAIISGAAMGAYILETFPYDTLYPLEDLQELLWHPVYFDSSGEFIQVRLYASDSILLNAAISDEGFKLEGMILHTTPKGELL